MKIIAGFVCSTKSTYGPHDHEYREEEVDAQSS